MFLKRVKIKKIHESCGGEVAPMAKENLPEEYLGEFRLYCDINQPYYCINCKTYVFKRFSLNETLRKIKEAGK